MKIMRVIYLLISLLLVSTNILAGSGDAVAPKERPTVAVVLSGGSAMGFAHIGVLKVLEEVGIPVDMVVGTSMGGLIGGLYAVGYTPREMVEISDNTDWTSLFLSPSLPYSYSGSPAVDRPNNIISFSFDKNGFGRTLGLVSDQKVLSLMSNLVINMSAVRDFDQLYIPFRTVAVDIISGDTVVFDSGRLVDAMRATMSIPGVFSPYEIDGRFYIDGGAKNNLPVDVAREMGADIVIAVDVDLEGEKSIQEMRSTVDVFARYIEIVTDATEEDQIKNADVYIRPDLTGLTLSQFGKYRDFIERGEAAARNMMDELTQLRDTIAQSRDCVPLDYNRKGFYTSLEPLSFESITVSNDPEGSFPLRLFDKLSSKTMTQETQRQIRRVIEQIVATGKYESVSYALSCKDGEGTGYNLELKPVLTERGKHSFGVGFKFTGGLSYVFPDDPWYLSPSLTVSLLFTELFGTDSHVAIDVSIGNNTKANLKLFVPFNNQVYLNPSISLFNESYEEEISDEIIENRSILLSVGQEVGLLIGQSAELGIELQGNISWLEQKQAGYSTFDSNLELFLGPSFSWKDIEDTRFNYEGIISHVYIHFPVLPEETWYGKFVISHRQNIPIIRNGTLSYDLLLGSYKGKFTTSQMSFDIGGWDGIPGYLPKHLVKDDVFLMGCRYQQRFEELSEILGADIYAVGEARIGNGWDDFWAVDDFSVKYGVGIGVGIRSFLGDIVIGAGMNQNGETAYYLLMN